MDDALKLQLNNLQLSKVTSTDKVIGRGAYGRVIEVYVHGTLCAAKETHPALIENVSAQESEAIKRSFCEECVKASRIHHPNIVQMLGIYYPTPQAKLPWLVMELMQTSLKGFLEKYKQRKVPLHFKLSILVDVAQGLEFLHGQNIIHRDLSSNNVLLTKNLIAKIADLGVAKVVQENKMKTHTQAPGTTHFMPPEALKSKPHYGKPVDVFSLACVALHVMSRQWPEPKDLLPEDTMTAFTEIQRRDEYIAFCTHPALKELVELCLNNKPERRPEISAVCVKLAELKGTIEKQIPFATDSNFELFDVVRETNIQNQKLTAANKKLTDTVAQLKEIIQEKDQQIQEKDQEIKELQMVNKYSTRQHHKETERKQKDQKTENKPFDISDLPPPDRGEGDEFGLVTQHINPSSHIDDDDNQLIKDSTLLGYRNPPKAKSQVKPIQPRADPARYPGGYRPSDWPPPTTSLPSERAVVPPNRDDKFDNTHVQVSREGQYQPVEFAVSDNNAVDQPTPETSQAPPISHSKFGKANLNALRKKLQLNKETTQTVVQIGGASPLSQAIGNHANAEIPYQGVLDSSTKPVARKTDLTSLRDRLEKTKEEREKTLTAGNVNKIADEDYCNIEEAQYTPENPVMINNPPNKRPMAIPRTLTPANHASNDTRSAFYRLWQCAHCQTVNEAHHTACEHCKLPLGRKADRSYLCNFCQLKIFIPVRWVDFKDTSCPRCKHVYESAL